MILTDTKLHRREEKLKEVGGCTTYLKTVEHGQDSADKGARQAMSSEGSVWGTA